MAQIAFSVDNASAYRRTDDVWVQVEKYLYGNVIDMGGKNKANVHLELENGQTLIMTSTQDFLSRDEQNRLYRPALLHVTAEENLLTGALRNLSLLAFEAHQPRYDEDEFNLLGQCTRLLTVAPPWPWPSIPPASGILILLDTSQQGGPLTPHVLNNLLMGIPNRIWVGHFFQSLFYLLPEPLVMLNGLMGIAPDTKVPILGQAPSVAFSWVSLCALSSRDAQPRLRAYKRRAD